MRGKEGEEQGEYRYQGNVGNRALELLGNELGMFINRKEVGKPGDFAGMTDDELYPNCRVYRARRSGSWRGRSGNGSCEAQTGNAEASLSR